MTRLELAKHTLDTIYETLLTLVNEGQLCPEDAEDLLFRKSVTIRQSLVRDNSASCVEYYDFVSFCQEREDFFTFIKFYNAN